MLYDDLKFISQKEIKAQLERSDMTTIKYFQFPSHYKITFISTPNYSVPERNYILQWRHLLDV